MVSTFKLWTLETRRKGACISHLVVLARRSTRNTGSERERRSPRGTRHLENTVPFRCQVGLPQDCVPACRGWSTGGAIRGDRRRSHNARDSCPATCSPGLALVLTASKNRVGSAMCVTLSTVTAFPPDWLKEPGERAETMKTAINQLQKECRSAKEIKIIKTLAAFADDMAAKATEMGVKEHEDGSGLGDGGRVLEFYPCGSC
jgi:hypothetical protein